MIAKPEGGFIKRSDPSPTGLDDLSGLPSHADYSDQGLSYDGLAPEIKAQRSKSGVGIIPVAGNPHKWHIEQQSLAGLRIGQTLRRLCGQIDHKMQAGGKKMRACDKTRAAPLDHPDGQGMRAGDQPWAVLSLKADEACAVIADQSKKARSQAGLFHKA